MSEVVVSKIKKLLAQTNCPACGSTLEAKAGDAAFPTHRAITQYECAAEFMVDHNGFIIASQPCWSASHVAARALNQEADQDAAKITAIAAPVTASSAPPAHFTHHEPGEFGEGVTVLRAARS